MINQSPKRIFFGVLLLMAMSIALPSYAQLKIGAAAPEFKLDHVNGKGQVALSDYRDKKIVIVHFWKSK